jgi:hypothetical protein
MSKQAARNALIVIGMWALAKNIAILLNALVAVIHSRGTTFTGDAGIVMMWLSEGIVDDLVAALVAISLVWAIEARKPSVSIGGLAALYLYSGGMNAWRILRRWHGPRMSDYIGIVTQAIIPALACLIVGLWWARRRALPKAVAT